MLVGVDARLSEYVRGQWPALLRYAALLCGESNEAEEVLQSTLTRVALRWRFVDDKDDPDGYVRRALVRACIDSGKRRRSEPAADEPLDVRVPDDGARLADVDLILRALAILPPRQRAVLILRYLDDASEAVTADALGCSVGTVRSQCAKGLARLRELVEMDRVEGLLRDALETAPAPAFATTDPLGDIKSRIDRTRRRRRAALAIAAVAVAAIVVPLGFSGGKSKRPASPARLTKVLGRVSAVASGGGYVWTLRQDVGHHHRGVPAGLVTQRKPGTLQAVRTYRVPGPADFVAYGLNRIWVYGGRPRASADPNSRLSVINLGSGHQTTLPFGRRPIGDLDFQSGRAWMLGDAPQQLIPLEINGDAVRFGRAIAAPKATTLAAGNGLIYALAAPHLQSGPEDTVAIVDARSGRPAVTQRPVGHILLVLPGGYLVVGNHRLVSEGDSRLAVGPILRGQVGPAAATVDPTTGTVYVVGVSGSCRYFPCQQELEYSVKALARGTKRPLAVTHSRPHGEIFSVAADPSGSLLVTNGQSLFRWTPSH